MQNMTHSLPDRGEHNSREGLSEPQSTDEVHTQEFTTWTFLRVTVIKIPHGNTISWNATLFCSFYFISWFRVGTIFIIVFVSFRVGIIVPTLFITIVAVIFIIIWYLFVLIFSFTSCVSLFAVAWSSRYSSTVLQIKIKQSEYSFKIFEQIGNARMIYNLWLKIKINKYKINLKTEV